MLFTYLFFQSGGPTTLLCTAFVLGARLTFKRCGCCNAASKLVAMERCGGALGLVGVLHDFGTAGGHGYGVFFVSTWKTVLLLFFHQLYPQHQPQLPKKMVHYVFQVRDGKVFRFSLFLFFFWKGNCPERDDLFCWEPSHEFVTPFDQE